MSEPKATAERTIVRAAIYPAIGVSRVGNSGSEFFLAPEVNDPMPEGFLSRPDWRPQASGGTVSCLWAGCRRCAGCGAYCA
jgi:hypothetical protein